MTPRMTKHAVPRSKQQAGSKPEPTFQGVAAPFDPSPYVHAPTINASSGVTLALALVDASPTSAPPIVKKAAKYLKTVAEKARADLAERNRQLGVLSEDDVRALDNEGDCAWGGLQQRLGAMAMLSPERFPQAKRAAELSVQLFPEGMEFLKANYATQSTKMASILEHIDMARLDAEIDALAGKEFLQAIRHVQPRYEAMVNERLRRDKVTSQNLADTVRAIQGAIVNYASKVIGTIEHDEPDTAEVARLALLPITNHRDAAALRGRRATKEPATEPEAEDPKPE